MKLHLRYCAMWNYEPRAVSLAAKLLETFKERLAGLELQPSRGGCFELSADGQTLYSKLATGQFPDEAAMVEAVRRCLS